MRYLVWLPQLDIYFAKFCKNFFFSAFLYIRTKRGAPSSARKKCEKNEFFSPPLVFGNSSGHSIVMAQNRASRDVMFNRKFRVFDEKIACPYTCLDVKNLVFFLRSPFFVCFFGPALCFSNDAQLRPRAFYLIFRTRCGCTSHLFLCAKIQKI